MVKTNNNRSKEVVVILPYTNNKVLMQLRDMKKGIAFPGCWGFFGGSIDDGETPDDASARELFEEIGYKPAIMHKLGFEIIPDLGNTTSHAYCCQLTIPVSEIKLNEGFDIGLFSLEEIMTKKLYSQRMGKPCPVIEVPALFNTIKKLWKYLNIAF